MPDRHEFADLLREDYRRLFGYVLSLVHHLDDAQDILQETCQTLWEKFDEYDASKPFGNWAMGIARYKALQHLERRQRDRRGLDLFAAERLAELMQQGTPEEQTRRVDALRMCLKKLDDRDRSLVQRCYEGTLSVRQVAEQLGRSASSLHNTLNRIRGRLLGCIQRNLATEAQP